MCGKKWIGSMHRLYKSHFFTQFAKLFLLIPNRKLFSSNKTKKQMVDR